MSPIRKPADAKRQAELRAGLRRDKALKERSYRTQALKLFPHICGRCGREFDGRRLRELTVHHRDHDHTNNPTNGSNWELLCLYCHDNEHEKYRFAGGPGLVVAEETQSGPSIANPFDGLDGLLGGEKGEMSNTER
jgi:hypothetical protein